MNPLQVDQGFVLPMHGSVTCFDTQHTILTSQPHLDMARLTLGASSPRLPVEPPTRHSANHFHRSSAGKSSKHIFCACNSEIRMKEGEKTKYDIRRPLCLLRRDQISVPLAQKQTFCILANCKRLVYEMRESLFLIPERLPCRDPPLLHQEGFSREH